ncbi:hypothetical protein [Acaryochloris sp. CCMEE 5410]|nr:hypothetical protein [Acaryochloris sp. CCMEE 5410]
MFKQLELDFASTLASALDEPEQADVLQLWNGMLPELQALSQ